MAHGPPPVLSSLLQAEPLHPGSASLVQRSSGGSGGLNGMSPKTGGSPDLTHTCHSGPPQVSPAPCWQLSTTEVPREMPVHLCAVRAVPGQPPAPGMECTRGGSGCISAPVCHEWGRVFHNCGSVFALEAKVGGSLGRALWRTVDTVCYLWEAEIVAIFSSMLGPCAVVFVISPQLSTPPALLRDEKSLFPGMRKRLHIASLWGSVVELVPSTTDSSGRRVPLSHHVSLGFPSSFNEYLPQHILVQDMVAPAPLGCSPAGLLRKGTLSFSAPPEGPSFPCHAPSRATSTSRLE